MAQMKYRPLSLKNMAVRKLAANLFQKPSILSAISNFHSRFCLRENHYSSQVWKETFEDKFPDEISKFGLPKPLSKLLFEIVDPMSQQVRRWKEFHEDYLRNSLEEEMYFDIPILEKLCWTSAGAVDYQKTAKELIISDVVDTVKKFKLSCLYCFEDYVSVLWRELTTENKKYFCWKGRIYLQSGATGQEFWWPYIINGHESILDDLTRSYRGGQVTFHQYAFQCSAQKGNKAAADHFFQKLTPEEKEVSLMTIIRHLIECQSPIQRYRERKFPRQKFPELLSYLLSVMTPDQQMRVFEETPLDILEWFLESPLPDMFLEIADNVWDFLTDDDRDDVLCSMYDKLKLSSDYSAKIFQEFFHRISTNFWMSFVDRQSNGYFLGSLIEHDTKALEILFRSLDASAKKRLVFSEPALTYFDNLLLKGQLDIVEMCLREASLSPEDKRRLKEGFMRYLTSIKVNEMRLKTRKWIRFFQFLDETDNDGKRGSEDEIPTEAKKRKTKL